MTSFVILKGEIADLSKCTIHHEQNNSVTARRVIRGKVNNKLVSLTWTPPVFIDDGDYLYLLAKYDRRGFYEIRAFYNKTQNVSEPGDVVNFTLIWSVFLSFTLIAPLLLYAYSKIIKNGIGKLKAAIKNDGLVNHEGLNSIVLTYMNHLFALVFVFGVLLDYMILR